MGVWIEIGVCRCGPVSGVVTPFMGVWIEMVILGVTKSTIESLPLWECGLKQNDIGVTVTEAVVTPFMGVWIEISISARNCACNCVTPFMGVWIEIFSVTFPVSTLVVTPFMGVWIEIKFNVNKDWLLTVTPFMGVWIEIMCAMSVSSDFVCHSLYGSVD